MTSFEKAKEDKVYDKIMNVIDDFIKHGERTDLSSKTRCVAYINKGKFTRWLKQNFVIHECAAWTPKDGEAVFLFTGHENRVHVGRFDGFEVDGRYKVITISGECARTNAHCIKPFSADKIGKPWEEI